jgi:hypothetical protein
MISNGDHLELRSDQFTDGFAGQKSVPVSMLFSLLRPILWLSFVLCS